MGGRTSCSMVGILAALLLCFSYPSSAEIIGTYAGNGTAGFSGDGGPATQAGLNNPQDVAIDSQGNLYIADLW